MRRYLLLSSFLFAVMSGSAQEYSFENLVFEGAGIRGLAYCGVLAELEASGVMEGIQRVAGTSAGAITALGISLGFSSEEMYALISETQFQKFNDPGFRRLKGRYGFYKGDNFEEWLEDVIRVKTENVDITFRELKEEGFLDFYAVATCLNKQKLLVFSAATYPNMRVKDAVRISMSIPLYFEAIYIDDEGRTYKNPKEFAGLDLVVDGGIIGNYPIDIFDSVYVNSEGDRVRIPNEKTIGIRIDTDEQIEKDAVDKALAEMEVEKLSDYMEAFYTIMLESLNRNTLLPADWERTISISDAGIGPRIKKLSPEQKEALVERGRRGVQAFLGQGASEKGCSGASEKSCSGTSEKGCGSQNEK